ncbi:MAG TPA: phosphoheptose isomerase [candidate division Zixibacteria bacterium]|jgi:D-sedoheptulose 7-phosphate isomerase|nr:phosphoheptose isomerase [candidate division Zixibacteria bacterium]
MTRQADVALVRRDLEESARNLILAGKQAAPAVAEAAETVFGVFSKGGKLLICGNGGSAADSQHLAAELVVRFERERRPLAAVALTTDTSLLTAEANDHGFETVFSRQVLALGRRGDALLAISTSGNSPNTVAACRQARKLGLKVIGLTGPSGGRMARHCHLVIKAPGGRTAAIQECQLALGHALCGLVESGLAR